MLTISQQSQVNQVLSSQQAAAASAEQGLSTKEAFQDFVAGTFYKQMLKAMRGTQQKVQYLDGGQAEESFRSQLDQQVAEDLAREHGAAFSDSLYKVFQTQLKARSATQNEVASQNQQIDYFA